MLQTTSIIVAVDFYDFLTALYITLSHSGNYCIIQALPEVFIHFKPHFAKLRRGLHKYHPCNTAVLDTLNKNLFQV